MLRLRVDKKVLDALKIAVPKMNKGKERLDKYVSNLEQVVNSQIFQTRTAWMLTREYYWASLTAIQEHGGQIWSLKNVRTHKWLEDNGLNLVEQINQGQANNITGEIAIIKFTSLVKIEDDEDLIKLQAMTNAQLDQYLISVPPSDVAAYQSLLSAYNDVPVNQIATDYDLLNVNAIATIDYIKKLVRSKVKNKDKTEYRKALRILRIAQVNNNIYPQKKKRSDFGRTYYEGLSIQSVSKDLRKAILQGCYEYDVKSSVVAWKLAFAPELLLAEKNGGAIENDFLAIYYYLTYKKDYFDDLQKKIFANSTGLSDVQQVKLIKDAMTALSFGAKMIGRWKNHFGAEQESSVVKIFGNHYKSECEKFSKSFEVTEFVRQQSMLDKFIISKFTEQYPYLAKMSSLQTKSGRLSKSKVLAWLYQTAESIAMNFVRDELKNFNVSIQANIHDAIVVDRQLNVGEVQQVVQAIKDKTNLIYFAFGETHYV
jgi:hypothetical protein